MGNLSCYSYSFMNPLPHSLTPKMPFDDEITTTRKGNIRSGFFLFFKTHLSRDILFIIFLALKTTTEGYVSRQQEKASE
jgi:hypothetical protein